MPATNVRSATQRSAGPAWKAAETYGCDMSLIESNLLKTPADRLRAHANALDAAIELREAMERHRREAVLQLKAIKEGEGL